VNDLSVSLKLEHILPVIGFLLGAAAGGTASLIPFAGRMYAHSATVTTSSSVLCSLVSIMLSEMVVETVFSGSVYK